MGLQIRRWRERVEGESVLANQGGRGCRGIDYQGRERACWPIMGGRGCSGTDYQGRERAHLKIIISVRFYSNLSML